jgi:phosphate starvation-inducible membrane PsiE
MMCDEEEDYLTPRYLLWICIGLGSIVGVIIAGALITALATSAASVFTLAGLVLLLVLAFLLVSIGARSLQGAPD